MGDAPAAVAIGREALALSEGGEPWSRAIACLALGIALHAVDERDDSYPYLEEVVALSAPRQAPAVVALSHLAHTDLDRDDLALAERRARRRSSWRRRSGTPSTPHAAGAHAGLAQARSRRGDHAAAREDADRAVDLARRGHSGPETAHALLSRAEVALAAGDRDRARRDADEARAMLEGADRRPQPAPHAGPGRGAARRRRGDGGAGGRAAT